MRPLKNDYEGLTAGTIHTAQGREADVVILVLGGNARRPGAMAWAAQKPNMLNVAVSRARRRLYVIGDRAAWSGLPHFDVLAESLESERAVRALAEGPARR
jgi:superfamily I DNA and/or RNA helicase